MTTPPSLGFKRPESVLVVVFSADGWVLMLRRVAPRGYWQSVTGSLEWGERATQAAVRELREETGLCIQPTELVRGHQRRFRIIEPWRARYAPEVRFNREHAYFVRLPTRVPVRLSPAEHAEAVWVSPHQALRMARSRTNRAAVRRLL